MEELFTLRRVRVLMRAVPDPVTRLPSSRCRLGTSLVAEIEKSASPG